ncbi:hypothetical protein [Massilia sp. TSP1-1-2]|uniref:hypothetical protein n=1 Tax=Massilia sp. TSP1-1-2 TaxID=2804649 RepID=UPI003CEB770C
MKLFASMIVVLSLMSGAFASPGAHGPNGEHLDGQANTGPAGSVPRVETFTEMFELAGQLSGGELSVMIDRYETNEPVLNGTLEVQYKDLKALAKFHADMGDYAIDDEKLLKELSKPGKHALLFTFVAGEESDLLEGTLEVPSSGTSSATSSAMHEHQHTSYWTWAALAALAAGAVFALVFFLRRRARKVTS